MKKPRPTILQSVKKDSGPPITGDPYFMVVNQIERLRSERRKENNLKELAEQLFDIARRATHYLEGLDQDHPEIIEEIAKDHNSFPVLVSLIPSLNSKGESTKIPQEVERALELPIGERFPFHHPLEKKEGRGVSSDRLYFWITRIIYPWFKNAMSNPADGTETNALIRELPPLKKEYSKEWSNAMVMWLIENLVTRGEIHTWLRKVCEPRADSISDRRRRAKIRRRKEKLKKATPIEELNLKTEIENLSNPEPHTEEIFISALKDVIRDRLKSILKE